jgi:putative secretion ATPase (PEP-CTERM system associated)
MYETYFKLRGKPFQLNPDPAFFFGSRGHRRAMAYLEYGLHQNEGFIIITGEIGAGKTTLVRSLLDHLDPAKVVAAHVVSTQIDADDVLRVVAAAFGLSSRGESKAGLLLTLETFLVSVAAAGKRALLIIDEAQNLTTQAVEELRMLSNFQLEDHALLQSFLIGQPEFRDIMQGAQMQQLRQRVIASYHLGPLDLQETRAYVEHRLAHVSWNGDPEFTDEAFNLIYMHSGGIPRRINTLCDRLMLGAFLAERHQIGETDVEEVVAELTEEFASPSAARAPGNGAAAGAGAERTFEAGAIDPSRLHVSSQLADQVSDMAARFDVQRIEARIAGLEQSMAATLEVLHHLLEAVRRDSSSGSKSDDA